MVFEFILIAFCIFMVIRTMNRLSNLRKKQAEAAPVEAPVPSKEEELLTEIRDLLRSK
jgi:large conductance mechanosensitive channel